MASKRQREIEMDPRVATPLTAEEKAEALHRFLDEEIRPMVPEELRGKGVSKAERERILGLSDE